MRCHKITGLKFTCWYESLPKQIEWVIPRRGQLLDRNGLPAGSKGNLNYNRNSAAACPCNPPTGVAPCIFVAANDHIPYFNLLNWLVSIFLRSTCCASLAGRNHCEIRAGAAVNDFD